MTNSKKILILSRREERPEFDTAKALVALLQQQSETFTYTPAFLEKIGIVYDGHNLRICDHQNNDIATYDAVFLMGWFKMRHHEEVAQAVSLYAEAKRVKVLNTEALHNRSRGKISQYVRAALSGISTMPFAVCINKARLAALAQQAGISYPMVIKSITGSRGRDNFLVHDDQELADALDSVPQKAFVAQPFVLNDGDYRLLIAGQKVRLAIRRQASDDSHLNNTSQGAQAELVDPSSLPSQMLKEAVIASNMLRREITGVDMIVDKQTGQHYFLEANNMPQLSTGSFVHEKAQMLDDFFGEWLA